MFNSKWLKAAWIPSQDNSPHSAYALLPTPQPPNLCCSVLDCDLKKSWPLEALHIHGKNFTFPSSASKEGNLEYESRLVFPIAYNPDPFQFGDVIPFITALPISLYLPWNKIFLSCYCRFYKRVYSSLVVA